MNKLNSKTNPIINISLLFLFVFFCYNPSSAQDKQDNFTYNYSLKDLSELTITTGSIKEEKRKSAPSNITIITHQMIEERGYKTLVDICQDIPGFDFMMFNDGGGEYPTFCMNRGIGDVGNPEILIMIDGIIQNNISFNWSLLWTYENILIDVDKIEIIQGPGSVMYGAQAFTGIIHIITQKNHKGIDANILSGSHSTQAAEVFIGSDITKDLKLSLAFHYYNSEGDGGDDRYDPGNYFHNILRPATILANYDAEGNLHTNTINPDGGKHLEDGFNTHQHNYAIRSKLTYKDSELGFFITDNTRAYGSAIVAYEYDLNDLENTNHYRNYNIYAHNQTALNPKLSLASELVFRATNIIPDGGFKYLYRFTDMRKNYAGYSHQTYLEEKLLFDLDSRNDLSFGFKASISSQSDRIISLGIYPENKQSTPGSWDIAVAGDGINQFKKYPTYNVKEFALYTLWDHQLDDNFSSSFGIRYDYNSEYGSVINPRFAIDFNRTPAFGAKFIYGRAFRQPSIFELYSEFRGNPNLTPQNINTYETEFSSLLFNEQLSTKLNIYYSVVQNLIGKVDDTNMPSGERFENIGTKKIGGLSYSLLYQLNKTVRLSCNYNFITGYNNSNKDFYKIDRTARHKINAGISAKFLDGKLSSDFRVNYVGKRKAPITNKWLQTYKDGYAPSYFKANWVTSYRFNQNLMAQLIVNNVFNTQFYGIGRENGSGFINDYDYINNVNPDGYIPPYHPQPGRNLYVNLIYKLHQ
ncbi:TonB-dependent receptor plug domain-containing protein [Plebeiibacterium marinum]|uniref:TonB-dependent receptor n=1 Tax=Plebeiibacterium marinum TaxID=2992111 RepID=A0AAE3MI13_9BACT|nr:TonB-dependent receptor [Plebeiobacterium marinum]MCW3808011.1 TonB-dependent receptor [Plebeiobacterium marinum]